MIDKKFCVKCNKIKSVDNFHFNKNTKDGFHCYCKDCRKILSKIYNKENKERENKKSRKYWWENREKNLEKRKEYYQENKNWLSKNYKIYYRNNKKKFNERSKKYNKKRRAIDPVFKLNGNISNGIFKALRDRGTTKQGKSTFDILPYTVNQLMQRLECQFKINMSWDNYGKWHVDHKKSKSSFNYQSVNDQSFFDCWVLSNLQPLWAEDNFIKNKY